MPFDPAQWQDARNVLDVLPTDLAHAVQIAGLPALGKALDVPVRDIPLEPRHPWTRTLGKMTGEVVTQGWRFPMPLEPMETARTAQAEKQEKPTEAGAGAATRRPRTHLRPPSDLVMFKDRLLYLLQPPLEDLFVGKQVQLPFQPYPYQVKGIAFLMPRHAALLADEMGLGKTAQVLIALRLLLARRADPPGPDRLPQAARRQLDARAAHLGRGRSLRGHRRRHPDAPGPVVRLELPRQAGQLRAADARCGAIRGWSSAFRRVAAAKPA